MPPISIKPHYYYLGIWFCEWEQGNVLACAWRKPGDVYEGAFRFKEKYIATHVGMQWYTVKIPPNSDCDITEAFDSLFRLQSLKFFCDVIYTPIDGHGEKAWRIFSELPFTKVSDKEGVERPLKDRYKSDENWN